MSSKHKGFQYPSQRIGIPISVSRIGNSIISFVTRRDATLLLVRKAYITCLWVFYFSSFAGNSIATGKLLYRIFSRLMCRNRLSACGLGHEWFRTIEKDNKVHCIIILFIYTGISSITVQNFKNFRISSPYQNGTNGTLMTRLHLFVCRSVSLSACLSQSLLFVWETLL